MADPRRRIRHEAEVVNFTRGPAKSRCHLERTRRGTIADYKYPVGGYATRKRSRFEQRLLLMRARNVETESSRESGNIHDTNEFLFGYDTRRQLDNHDLGNYRRAREIPAG